MWHHCLSPLLSPWRCNVTVSKIQSHSFRSSPQSPPPPWASAHQSAIQLPSCGSRVLDWNALGWWAPSDRCSRSTRQSCPSLGRPGRKRWKVLHAEGHNEWFLAILTPKWATDGKATQTDRLVLCKYLVEPNLILLRCSTSFVALLLQAAAVTAFSSARQNNSRSSCWSNLYWVSNQWHSSPLDQRLAYSLSRSSSNPSHAFDGSNNESFVHQPLRVDCTNPILSLEGPLPWPHLLPAGGISVRSPTFDETKWSRPSGISWELSPPASSPSSAIHQAASLFVSEALVCIPTKLEIPDEIGELWRSSLKLDHYMSDSVWDPKALQRGCLLCELALSASPSLQLWAPLDPSSPGHALRITARPNTVPRIRVAQKSSSCIQLGRVIIVFAASATTSFLNNKVICKLRLWDWRCFSRLSTNLPDSSNLIPGQGCGSAKMSGVQKCSIVKASVSKRRARLMSKIASAAYKWSLKNARQRLFNLIRGRYMRCAMTREVRKNHIYIYIN